MANSRLGPDLVQIRPETLKVHAKLADASVVLGSNTLVGIDTSGLVRDIDPANNDYIGALVALEEINGADGVDVKDGLVTDVVIKAEGAGFTDADLFAEVYATDEKTVTKSAGTDNRPKVGRIVEVVSATEVYVHVHPAYL